MLSIRETEKIQAMEKKQSDLRKERECLRAQRQIEQEEQNDLLKKEMRQGKLLEREQFKKKLEAKKNAEIKAEEENLRRYIREEQELKKDIMSDIKQTKLRIQTKKDMLLELQNEDSDTREYANETEIQNHIRKSQKDNLRMINEKRGRLDELAEDKLRSSRIIKVHKDILGEIVDDRLQSQSNFKRRETLNSLIDEKTELNMHLTKSSVTGLINIEDLGVGHKCVEKNHEKGQKFNHELVDKREREIQEAIRLKRSGFDGKQLKGYDKRGSVVDRVDKIKGEVARKVEDVQDVFRKEGISDVTEIFKPRGEVEDGEGANMEEPVEGEEANYEESVEAEEPILEEPAEVKEVQPILEEPAEVKEEQPMPEEPAEVKEEQPIPEDPVEVKDFQFVEEQTISLIRSIRKSMSQSEMEESQFLTQQKKFILEDQELSIPNDSFNQIKIPEETGPIEKTDRFLDKLESIGFYIDPLTHNPSYINKTFCQFSEYQETLLTKKLGENLQPIKPKDRSPLQPNNNINNIDKINNRTPTKNQGSHFGVSTTNKKTNHNYCDSTLLELAKSHSIDRLHRIRSKSNMMQQSTDQDWNASIRVLPIEKCGIDQGYTTDKPNGYRWKNELRKFPSKSPNKLSMTSAKKTINKENSDFKLYTCSKRSPFKRGGKDLLNSQPMQDKDFKYNELAVQNALLHDRYDYIIDGYVDNVRELFPDRNHLDLSKSRGIEPKGLKKFIESGKIIEKHGLENLHTNELMSYYKNIIRKGNNDLNDHVRSTKTDNIDGEIDANGKSKISRYI